MTVSIDFLNNQMTSLKLTVGSFDFRINSLQLTINQLEASMKAMPNGNIDVTAINKSLADLKSSMPKVITVNGQDLSDFLNGRELKIVG